MIPKKSTILLLLLLLLLIISGTTGYMIIENYSFIDALFMTIITISTVGYSTIGKLSELGIIFTIILIISSIIAVALIVQNFSRYISDGNILTRLRIRKTKKMMRKIENHVIVCGYGQNGSHAAMELIHGNQKVVVLDRSQKIIDDAQLHDIDAIFIHGDATHEEFLLEAKVEKAKALITSLKNDADNLYVVLSARELNPDIKIVSKAVEISAERKLRRAGADHVILPDSVGGIRMAKLVFEPEVIEFLEFIVAKSGISVNLVEIDCQDLKDSFIGKSISELDIRRKSGANIIGIKQSDGEYIFNPTSDEKIMKGVKLFVLGTPKQVDYFKDIVEEH